MNICLFNHKSTFQEPRCNYITGLADAVGNRSGSGVSSQASGEVSSSGGYVSTAQKRDVRSGDQYGMAMLSGDFETGGSGSGSRGAIFNFASGGSTLKADQVNENSALSSSKMKWIAIILGVAVLGFFVWKKV